MLLLRDHLQQDRAGDVALGLLVDDHEVDPLDHQPADIGERDVPTLYRVVQPPVGILLNYSRFAHRRSLTMGYAPSVVLGRFDIPYYIRRERRREPNSPSALAETSLSRRRGRRRGLPARRGTGPVPSGRGPIRAPGRVTRA